MRKSAGILPNRKSAMRLIGALLMETDEKWTSGRKYLDMAEYLEWRESKVAIMGFKVTLIG
jgi:transposase-like protein